MSTSKRRKLEDEDEEKEVVDLEESSEDTNDDEDDDDVELTDEEDDEFLNKEVQVNFGSYPPSAEDFDGIKKLLHQLWLKEHVDLNELTQKILDQKSVCSVIKQDEDEQAEDDEEDEEDDDDVFGVNAVISLNSDSECGKQIRKALRSRISNNKDMAKVLDSDSRIGLVVSERFINIPPRISLPTYQQLLSELNEDKETNKYEWLLLVSKTLHPKAKGKNEEVIYVNAEEELLDELAQERHEYSVADQCDGESLGSNWKDEDCLLVPHRRVLLLAFDSFSSFVNKLKQEFK